MVLLSLLTGPVDAQTAGDSRVAPADETLVLRTRLEKTIFKFDVLDLEILVRGEAAVQTQRWLTSAAWTAALADSIAQTLAQATDASAEITFLRDVGLKRFLKSIDGSMDQTVRVGWLSREDFERISRQMPVSYAFLSEEGIHDGDQILYTVQGDSLRVRYLDSSGRERLDEIDVGPERRIALLGSYFAPGSDFRDGLLRSARGQQEAR